MKLGKIEQFLIDYVAKYGRLYDITHAIQQYSENKPSPEQLKRLRPSFSRAIRSLEAKQWLHKSFHFTWRWFTDDRSWILACWFVPPGINCKTSFIGFGFDRGSLKDWHLRKQGELCHGKQGPLYCFHVNSAQIFPINISSKKLTFRQSVKLTFPQEAR